ncbi:MAG TPA: serine protease, partial [Pilimelia sp.]|nr:serine protease [Pilimelia sp.]
MRHVIKTVAALLAMVIGATVAGSALAAPAYAKPIKPNVVGGVPAALGEFPWMVRIFIPGGAGGALGDCGGTMVTRQVVLTAAHCVGPTGPTTAYRIRAAVVDLNSPNAIDVRSNFVHRAPGFVNVKQGKDWALIRLETPINLPTIPIVTDTQYNNGTFTVTGWGNTSENGSQTPNLMKADVPFVDDATCRRNYAAVGEPFVDDAMICAGFSGGGVDTCQGDSGGPMFRRDANNQWIQVGITSWGRGCARPNLPGIYTEVSTYSADIRSTVASLDPTADDFVVVNSASFEAGPMATGSFITIFTATQVTPENQPFSFPWPEITPAGLSVETDSCLPGGAKRLPILFAGPSGGGTQINLYYPNDYFGGDNTEPFGTCGADKDAVLTVHRAPGFGGDMSILVPISPARPGIFQGNGGGSNAPAGYHLNAVTGAQTSFDDCNADPARCPVATTNP